MKNASPKSHASPHSFLPSRAVTLPPAGSVILMTVTLAGMRHHAAAREELPLEGGMRVELRAEPANEHDPNAVAVHLPGGEQIGYLPRADNRYVARLLAQRVRLFGRLERVKRRGTEISATVSVLIAIRT